LKTICKRPETPSLPVPIANDRRATFKKALIISGEKAQ
jgi:hypothetical protein